MNVHEGISECIVNTPKRLAGAESMTLIPRITTLLQRLQQTFYMDGRS